MKEVRRCKACAGRYTPLQGDGTPYYHTCPTVNDTVSVAGSKRVGAVDERPEAGQSFEPQRTGAPSVKPSVAGYGSEVVSA